MLYLRLPALITMKKDVGVEFFNFSTEKIKNSIKLTFIIETIDAIDGGTLVVSSQQEKVLRVLKNKS